ncbi:hypothetical protein A0U42_11355 [Megasphaera sp. DISK 18]|nr:hypothetical protein A0U42_11355 [Megasphaera sp. DISK 18]
MVDYYKLLGVAPDASREEITQAYLTLAKKYHPDTTTLPRAKAEKKMALLQKAHGVLANPYEREQYDFLLSVEDPFESEAFLDMAERDYIPYCANRLMQHAAWLLKVFADNFHFEAGYEESNQSSLEGFFGMFLREEDEFIDFLEKSPYKSAKDLKPAFWVYYQFGIAYTYTHDKQQAIPFLERALTFVPDDDADRAKVQKLLTRVKDPNFKGLPDEPKRKPWLPRVIAFVIIGLIIASCASK